MSILGIDFGTNGGTLASIQQGKVITLRTEISERTTPALVNYATSGERIMGDAAAMTLNSNLKTTANNMKYLLGMRYSDKQGVEHQQRHTLLQIAEAPGGHCGYEVDGRLIVCSIQAASSFFVKLADVAKQALNNNAIGIIVVSVPCFYGPKRTEFLCAACEIAGYTNVQLIYEHKAIAMDYGIYRRTQFDAYKPFRTCFVDMGHGSTTVFVAEFTQNYCKIVSENTDENLGGRDMDELLSRHMNEIFKKQSGGSDALKNVKSLVKLDTVATKVKKTLSSNKEASFHLEYLLDGEDLSGMITRDEFVELCTPLRERLKFLLESILNLLTDKLDSVELVGNSTRVPWVIDVISEVTGVQAQRTLSADETVARGCALWGAVFSPTMRIKEYPIFDPDKKVPRTLRVPPPPKKDTKLKGGFFNKPAKETKIDKPDGKEEKEPVESPPEGEAETKTEAEEEPAVEEPEQEPEQEPEESEDPVPTLVRVDEDMNRVMEPYEPGVIRSFLEQEKEQKKRDVAAKKRETSINEFEAFVYLCGNRARDEWVNKEDPISGEAQQKILARVDEYQDFLYSNMFEDYKVYKKKEAELKEFVGNYVDDFKPKPKPPPVAEPVPVQKDEPNDGTSNCTTDTPPPPKDELEETMGMDDEAATTTGNISA